jgi:O-antigen ligase
MMDSLGPLWALAYACLALWKPKALPVALLFGCCVDWMLPCGGLNIYSNEWALAGSVLGLSWMGWRGELPALPTGLLKAFAPLALLLILQAWCPGPLGAGVKTLARDGQLFLGLFLPAWLLRGGALQRSLAWSLAFLALVSLLGLLQSALGPGSALTAAHSVETLGGQFQQAYSVFQHHNQFGAYLVAALTLTCTIAATGSWPALSRVAGVLGLLAILATVSRGSWLSLLLVAAVLCMVWPKLRKGLLLGGLLALGLALLVRPQMMLERLHASVSLQGNQDRVLIYTHALELAQGHLAWGAGPGTVAREWPVKVASLGLSPDNTRDFSAHVHNLWLQVLIESGIAGLLAWAFWLACSVKVLWRGAPPLLAWALLGALMGFVLQSFTDVTILHARGLAISLQWGLLAAGCLDAAQEGSRDER